MDKKTLAQFVQTKRDKLGMSPVGLAKACHLELDLIEKIEAGEELFLPTTIRQSLAKGLKCNPSEIKDLEKNFDTQFASQEYMTSLSQKILDGQENLICPKCQSLLETRIEQMYDLEDNLVFHPKARCIKCVFQLR